MDEMPKRRKRKDNPYILSKDEKNGLFLVSLKDTFEVYRTIEITKEIYEALDRFELDDLSEMNEYDLHIEHIPLDIELMSIRSSIKENIEDEILTKINEEEIIKAIYKLPDPQNSRVYLYLIKGFSLTEISKLEKCSVPAIKQSIDIGIRDLQKFLKKFLKMT